MEEFKIGDKVRSKLNNNLVGIVDYINVSYNNTIDVQSNDGNNMIVYSNPDNWELYFEVGDIVTQTAAGLVYRICDSGNDGFKLERFTDAGNRYTKFYYTLPDDIHMASDAEKSEFYRLKELHEIKEKINRPSDHQVDSLSYVYISTSRGCGKTQILKNILNNVYGAHICPSEELLEFSKELMNFKKEKETNNMRKFKIGDAVEHVIYGKGTISGREFHDLCECRPIPKFKQVIYNDPATIIFWEDGTKTIVKCKGEKYDELKGLMIGIVKKVYSLKKFYDIYEDTTKYVTGNKTLLNIEKGLAESVVKDLYGIKKINSKDDIYKVAMTDWFYVTTERK